MATRLYLPSSGTPAVSPTVRSSWERSSAAFVSAPLVTVKSNTALTTLSAVFGATTTTQTCYYQGVSDTLDVDQTITGTTSVLIGKCAETTTSGDAHLAFSIRVMQGDTSVERGLLFEHHAISTEFPVIANAATRNGGGAKTNTSVAALAGDRIVVELGIHGVTPANETMQMRVGDPTGTADFAFTEALTTDLDPWVEFSQNITFGTPPAAADDEYAFHGGGYYPTQG